MPLASGFTAPLPPSQHFSETTLSVTWRHNILFFSLYMITGVFQLFGLCCPNLHLLWWSAKRMFCHLSIALYLRIQSLSVPSDQQHQRCAPQIAGVEGLRPPQDGVFILCFIFDVVSHSRTYIFNPSNESGALSAQGEHGLSILALRWRRHVQIFIHFQGSYANTMSFQTNDTQSLLFHLG